jgi:hypothetical protein
MQPRSFALVDAGNRLAGYGLTGAAADSIFVVADTRANAPIGFVGYLKKSELHTSLLIYGQHPNCLVTSPPRQ